MRVLIACEFSGTVRDAFRALGHDAVSCDLLPTEKPGPHMVGDAVSLLGDGWDMLIAHPPCTYLANSGARWLFEQEGRWAKLDEGVALFRAFLNAPIPRIAIENPMPHKWATERIGRRYDFRVQPWEHGDKQKKTTCFWTKGLPPLLPSVMVGPPPSDPDEAKAWESVWREPPGPMQAHNRSRTFTGIAAAMASQWGGDVRQERAA